MSPDLGLLVVLGVLGLLVGSFLNVCIYRLPRDRSVVFPASHCPSCEHPLRWYHNVPVISWLLLGGRCAFCRAPIAWRYPAVELLNAGLWVLHGLLFPLEPLLFVRIAFASALLVLFFTDLDCRILPNELTVGGTVAGLVAAAFVPPGLRSAVIGVLLGGGVLWATGAAYERLRGVEGMGMGDVKMLAMIGAVLGWPLMLLTLVWSSIAGGLLGAVLLAFKADARTTALPFGSFLAPAALAASLVGQPVVDWYLGFYR
ncbi:prepilin peptidase [Luteitalea sp.]|uniref:prepilin peptidase n=1 Tax=Luteitalea sp. TaxID=2004800 RepID=UPI000A8FBBE9|nr:A24 family peptidase [Luteitalea sp.]